jgi:hypothetical protein
MASIAFFRKSYFSSHWLKIFREANRIDCSAQHPDLAAAPRAAPDSSSRLGFCCKIRGIGDTLLGLVFGNI